MTTFLQNKPFIPYNSLQNKMIYVVSDSYISIQILENLIFKLYLVMWAYIVKWDLQSSQYCCYMNKHRDKVLEINGVKM